MQSSKLEESRQQQLAAEYKFWWFSSPVFNIDLIPTEVYSTANKENGHWYVCKLNLQN